MSKFKAIINSKYILHGPGPEPAVPLSKDTVGQFIHKILLSAPKNATAMIDALTNQSLKYSELLQKSINLAQALRHHGYNNPKTVLAIQSENSVNYFVPILASLFNSSIIAPLSHLYKSNELKHALQISQPKLLFCSEDCAQKIADLKDLKLEKILVMSKTSGLAMQSMDSFIQEALNGKDQNIHEFQSEFGISSELIAFILCSSGTTGLPKGVTLSHLNVMTRLAQQKDPRYYSQNPDHKVLGLPPFFHAYGLSFILGCIANLQTIICLKKFEEDLYLKTIEDYKIDIVPLIPPLANFLAQSDKVLKYYLSSVSDIICAAAPLSLETERNLKIRLNCKYLRNCLGMTETTSAVTFIQFGEDRKGSCGKLVPFVSGKVIDPSSLLALGPNKIGELCFKGPLVMRGYYKNPEATKNSFTEDGWLKSGDLGYYDEEGFFYVVDRLKEVIKYKGYQVAPAELEAILINHPKIADAGVVGVPDKVAGEVPLAFVVRKAETHVGEEEIIKYVADKVSPQKRLRGGVIFVESIPKNPSGKILRRKLRNALETLKSKL
ncbi:unnamed protein product [Ceutorhynchus assimilis]|uniref:Luciferin 4-monooxygenase n=1 Tax=Ceutorhynchus assimilis TaxID=467358 RepID=A0A9N9QKN0_9CUCU|nr:unnamed protein product [Ceutorhynchus assimilis]